MAKKQSESVEKALEVLGEQLERVETKAERLEAELEDYKDIRRWMWARPLRQDEGEPDVDLPVPRLEMRQRQISEFEFESMQYLVLDDFALPETSLLFVPLGRTTTSSSNAWKRDPELPYRDGAHIFHHMAQLKLPGFLTRFDEDGEMIFCQELEFTSTELRDYTVKKYFDGKRPGKEQK